MKTLNSLKNFKKEIDKQNEILLQHYSDMKKEVAKKIESEKKELLQEICSEYDLDFNELSKKFLNVKKKSKKGKKSTSISSKLIDNSSDEENKNEMRDRALSLDVDVNPLLIKGVANGKDCYYEDKENGLVFDDQVQEIGRYKQGKIYLF